MERTEGNDRQNANDVHKTGTYMTDSDNKIIFYIKSRSSTSQLQNEILHNYLFCCNIYSLHYRLHIENIYHDLLDNILVAQLMIMSLEFTCTAGDGDRMRGILTNRIDWDR